MKLYFGFEPWVGVGWIAGDMKAWESLCSLRLFILGYRHSHCQDGPVVTETTVPQMFIAKKHEEMLDIKRKLKLTYSVTVVYVCVVWYGFLFRWEHLGPERPHRYLITNHPYLPLSQNQFKTQYFF